ncbi:MAG: Gfo/Idh/MocA family oxidoreductase [Candidatus Nanopelagicales bacterium]
MRVALVGCGRIAQRHAELLGNGHIPGLELAGVADVVPQRAQDLGERYGVPWFSDMHDLMRHVPSDLVSVLTDSGSHADITVALAPYGRHIVVEKPMALTLPDADAMIRACDANGIRLFVVKQNRFNVPIVKVRQALEAGRFGKIVMGTVRVRWCRPQSYYDQADWRGRWATDGGVLSNQASHHIDVLEWMLGDVRSVFAMSRTALVDIEAEDTAVVLVRFVSGALGVIEATTATRPKDLEGSLSILGENGSVEVGGFALNQMKTWQFTDPEDGDELILSEYSVNPPDVYGFGHRAYYEHIVDCLKNDKAQLVDGLEGRRSLELITAIYESIESGQEVPVSFQPRYSRLGMRDA